MFEETVEDKVVALAVAKQVERAWRWRVSGLLALTGAVCGTIVASFPQWRWRSPVKRNRWVFVTASALVYGGLVWAGCPGVREPSVFREAADYIDSAPGQAPLPDLYSLFVTSIVLLVPAALIGWAAQTVTVSWGARLRLGRLPDQAADYDDRAVPALPDAPDG